VFQRPHSAFNFSEYIVASSPFDYRIIPFAVKAICAEIGVFLLKKGVIPKIECKIVDHSGNKYIKLNFSFNTPVLVTGHLLVALAIVLISATDNFTPIKRAKDLIDSFSIKLF
jgi:hypothetical protein